MLDLNAVWIATYAASFVAQYEEERKRIGTAPMDAVPRIAEEAVAVADCAVDWVPGTRWGGNRETR